MKSGTLTFHASHNYGSMLQAFALQRTLINIMGDNEIIDLRTPQQKKLMRVISLRKKLGPILKDLTHLAYYLPLKKKFYLFESFIRNELITSKKEIERWEDIDMNQYDLICSGSDQIWNTAPEDFDEAYLQPYKYKGRKISYAVSMGPGRKSYPEPISKFTNWLGDFDRISVREEGTKNTVKSLCSTREIQVHCDPVFLLKKEKWLVLAGQSPIINGRYIFFYTVFATPLAIKIAKFIRKKYNLPVVISNFTNIHDFISPFRKRLKSGPKEFLNYMTFADKVITTSFHGTAFSIILNKPFISIDGIKDYRIGNLLALTGLEDRSVSTIAKADSIGWNIDFTHAKEEIAKERERAFKYLRECKDLVSSL